MKHSTRQRYAILESLRAAPGPMSPKEILEASRKQVPGLGIATVYRNLKLLVQEGVVRELVLPEPGTRYELSGLKHHHHFQCRGCDRVFCLDGCPGEIEALTPEGFDLEEHEIVLYGRCSGCIRG